ncbi:MAG TPA: dihydroneopterin triphosphate diphosphatase [Gammaproteobacteria bacterium]|jgi:dATP pyrophosphohydrolase|nr:dihydroneopterin triphosphate diphosphatase [Gammaproteobacteria bacterium]
MTLFKRPESVLVVIHTAGGEVLQLRRHEPAGFWQSVTGSLAGNETPSKAAIREVLEETGLVADDGLTDTGVTNRYPIHPAWQHKFAPGVKENTEYVFSLQLPERSDIRLDPAEHSEYRWLPREAAAAAAGSHTDRDAILALVPAT